MIIFLTAWDEIRTDDQLVKVSQNSSRQADGATVDGGYTAACSDSGIGTVDEPTVANCQRVGML